MLNDISCQLASGVPKVTATARFLACLAGLVRLAYKLSIYLVLSMTRLLLFLPVGAVCERYIWRQLSRSDAIVKGQEVL